MQPLQEFEIQLIADWTHDGLSPEQIAERLTREVNEIMHHVPIKAVNECVHCRYEVETPQIVNPSRADTHPSRKRKTFRCPICGYKTTIQPCLYCAHSERQEIRKRMEQLFILPTLNKTN